MYKTPDGSSPGSDSVSIENESCPSTEENLRKIQELANDLCGLMCPLCNKTFNSKLAVELHKKRVHSPRINCPQCGQTFTRNDNLKRHIERIHQKGKACNWCKKIVPLLTGKPFCEKCHKQGRECRDCRRPLPLRFFSQHDSKCIACHRKQQNQIGRGHATQTAMKGIVRSHTLNPTQQNKYDLLLFFRDSENLVTDILNNDLSEHGGVKWYMVLSVRLSRYTSDGEEISSEPAFRSLNMITINNGDIEQSMADAFQKLFKSFQAYQSEGSGWTLQEIINMVVHVGNYKPLRGSTYIPTPPALVKKMAIINVRNTDEYCFLWSILASLFPSEKNPNRVQHYAPHFHTLSRRGLTFPITLEQISDFESQNNLSVNVMGYEGGVVFPLRVTAKRCDIHINLLLISDNDARHYCLIKSMSRLLGDLNNHHPKTHYCNYCLHGFSSGQLLDQHQPICGTFGLQKILMPKDQFLTFKNIKAQLRVPFAIYADFECFTPKIHESTKNTNRYEIHKPSGFCYTVISSAPEYNKPPIVYRGPNVAETFLHELQNESRYICNILSEISPMSISPDEEQAFKVATYCHICGNELNTDRVRDHCHITGLYRGPAHNNCNLQYSFRTTSREEVRSFFIPVILHNCRGYDSHLICSVLGMFKHLKIGCIANNIQKYISFSVGNLRFIDSLQFMNASLDTLVSNMAKEGSDKFKRLKVCFPDPTQQNLLLRKGVYPYSYVTDDSKLAETELPSKESFFNYLTEEPLSDDDYIHAQTVWSKFQISNIGEYHDLYLRSDVLQLCDLFEEFRSICLSYYGLDPLHYYTSPGLSWDAMLKMTKVKLELLQDIDMHLFIESGLRGGISQISTKYAKANNPYLADYNPCLPTNYITYLDANNLYGWAMSECLPLKDFMWLTNEDIESFDVLTIPDNGPTGYILEVDVDYPNHLHHSHSDYPLCVERMTVTDSMLSDHSKSLKSDLDMKGKPTEKLIPNLCNKKNYIVHYRNLKFYLEQGMLLKKIHKGISFTQSAWLKPYIEFNTEKRKTAKNDFEKDFFKLMNNSVFGKTMENLRKRTRIELVHDTAKLEKLIAKPSFQCFRIFSPDLCGVHLKKTKLTLNRPIYLGLTVLDISKLLMYDFHYNNIKPKYGENAKLLFTDTDSFCYQIECTDIYSDMLDNSHLFDTSNFPKDHPVYSSHNAKVLGKFKDEVPAQTIEEFVGLRPKMYSLVYSGTEKKTAKGISKYAIKNKVKHVMYKECLFQRRVVTTNMSCIRSYDHQLYTVSVTKKALSPFDDKRYVLQDGYNTLAHGHFKIV